MEDVNTVKDMRFWLQKHLFSDAMYGSSKMSKDGWEHIKDQIKYEFSEEERDLCVEALDQILTELHEGSLSWDKNKIDRLLLVAHSEVLDNRLSENFKEIAESGGFEDGDLQRRLLQSLLWTNEYMTPDFWMEQLEENPEEHSSYALSGLAYFDLEDSFRVLDHIDTEEFDWNKTSFTRLYHSIRGLLANDQYDKEEVIEKAKESKKYVQPSSYELIRKALHEVDE